MSYFEKRQKLQTLKNGVVDNRLSVAEIKKLLDGKKGVLAKTRHSRAGLKNDPLYRARLNENSKLFSNISELIYPDPSKIDIPKGRCNDKGQSILYASTSELGTIVEYLSKGLGLYSMFTVASLKRKNKTKILYKPFGINLKPEVSVSKHNQILNEFCEAEFSKIIPKNNTNNNVYNFTIAISQLHLERSIITTNSHTGKKENTSFESCIAYPSVHCPQFTNKTTYNIAMTPEVFDYNYTISDICTYILVHDKDSDTILLTTINKAEINLENGDLNWCYPYDVMVDRLKKGMGYAEIKNKYIEQNINTILSNIN